MHSHDVSYALCVHVCPHIYECTAPCNKDLIVLNRRKASEVVFPLTHKTSPLENQIEHNNNQYHPDATLTCCRVGNQEKDESDRGGKGVGHGETWRAAGGEERVRDKTETEGEGTPR